MCRIVQKIALSVLGYDSQGMRIKKTGRRDLEVSKIVGEGFSVRVCLFSFSGCKPWQQEPVRAVFRYAAIDEAPTLDQHVVTSDQHYNCATRL